jgi:gliding motility-associated-like protein
MKKTSTPERYPFRTLFLLLTLLLSLTLAQAQTSTEFWFAPPYITAGDTGNPPTNYQEPLLLRITSSDLASTITITMPALGATAFGGAGSIVVNIPANTQQTVDLSAYKNDLFTAPWDTILNTGLKISATEEITVYYEVNSSRNPDIFALKGQNALGTQFYTPFNNSFGNGSKDDPPYTAFDIVATEDNTTVWIYPRVALEGGHPPLQAYSIVLDEGQTYSGAVASSDSGAVNPAGTVVASDKPIAITIKDDFAEPGPGTCKDLMGDQIVPVDIIGSEYVVVKGSLTNNIERVFLTATQNFTQILVDGAPETTLFAGETYDLPISNNLTHILCSNPTYALHISGFGCEVGAGLLPGLNCAGSDKVSFVRSVKANFGINVMVPAGNEGLFTINGDPTLLQAADFAVVPGTGGAWVGAKKEFDTLEIVPEISNTIQNTGSVFAMGIFNGNNSGTGARYGYFSEFSSKVFVDAGADRNSCENADVANLGGSVSGGAVSGEWTTSGDGTFLPNSTDLNATYEPGPVDIANGSVILTLTSTGNCFPVSDDMQVTFTPAPTADAGLDADICLNNTTINLNGAVTQAGGGQWSGGSGGSFLPNALTLNANYNPSPADLANGSVTLTLTTVAMASNCNAVDDVVTYTFIDAPLVDAGPASQNICSNNSDITLNGSVSWAHGPNPSVTWSTNTVVNPGAFDDPNALSTIYRPSGTELANGSVTLTLTSAATGSCNTVSDDIIINFTPSPTIIFDPSSSNDVCANNNEINLSAFLTVATGGTWSGGLGSFSGGATGLLNNIYTPTAQEVLDGTVTLTLTTTTGIGNCTAVSSDVTVTILPAPIVTATTPTTNKCANNASVPLTGSVTTPSGTPGIGVWTTTGSGQFLPNASISNPSYVPHPNDISNGSVVLTYTSMFSSPCLEESAQLTINFFPAPTVLVGTNPLSVCENNAEVVLNGTIVDAFGLPLTGTWSSNGTGIFTPNANDLNGTYTPSASDIANGTVQLTLSSDPAAGCNSVQEVLTVNFTPSPSVTATANPTTICTNNSDVVLDGTIVGASGGVWLGGLGVYSGGPNDLSNNTYTPTNAELSAGTFTLTLESTGNLNCNPVQDNVVITVIDEPIVDAGADFTYCTNNAGVPLNGIIQLFGPITGNSLWTSLGTGSFADPSAPTTTYSPSAADLLAGSVTLQLTYTSSSICNPVTDQIVVTFIDPPVVDAGPASINICENNAVTALNGSITFASGPTPPSLWSTSGGGSFDNPNDLVTNYNPTLADIAGGGGSVTLTLTSTPTLGCLSESDNIVVNFTPEPTVSIVAPPEVCANNSVITVSGSVTNATGGTWSNVNGLFSGGVNDLNNNDYTPTVPEINNGSVTFVLTTTGMGNCNAVQASQTVTVIDAPIVDAGANQTVCANNASITLNGTVTADLGGNGGLGTGQWSTSGTGSFANSNNLNTTYTPSAADIAAGTVDLTLTSTVNGLCTEESDAITITIVPSPVVDAGPATVDICANNSDVSLIGSITFSSGAPPLGTWTTSGSGSFVNANDLATTYIPSVADISGGAGSVTLTLTSDPTAGCLSESDNIVVNFTPAPTASIVAPAEVCANNSVITISGSVSNATGGTWSNVNGVFSGGPNDLNNNDYTPTVPEIINGSVTFILTTTGIGNCNSVQSSYTVSIIDAPIVDAGTSQTVCANNASIALNGTITSDVGGNGGLGTGQWSTSGTGSFANANNLNTTYTPSAADIAAGMVDITLTSTLNGLCASESDVITLTIVPSPVVDAGPPNVSICANNSDVNLVGTITFGSGAPPPGTWTTSGSGSFANANNLSTTYIPSAADISGGSGSVTLTLTSDPTANCLSEFDNIVVNFTPAPTASIVAPAEVCANNSIITVNGSVTNATGGTWSNVNGTFSGGINDLNNNDYTPTNPEINFGSVTFILTTDGVGNCLPVQASRTVDIIVAPIVDAGPDATVCANDASVNLSGTITNDVGGNGGFGTGVWSTTGTGSFSNPSNLNAIYTPSAADIAAGAVTLRLTSTANGLCNQEFDELVITIIPAPSVDAGMDQSICANNSVTALNGSITFSAGASPGGTWTTNGGGSFDNINDLITNYNPSAGDIAGGAGSVVLTLTSDPTMGCQPVADNLTINFTPAPTASIVSVPEVCANNAIITLNGSVTTATVGTWSNVNGVFSGGVNDLVNNDYTPTVPEINSGTVTFILTTNGNGNCLPVQASRTVNIIDAPVVDAGSDFTVCANNSAVALNGVINTDGGGNGGSGTGLWTTSGTGSFANAGNLNTTYTPSAADIAAGTVDLTLTSTLNGLCFGASDVITLTIVPSPVVDAGPANVDICANNAVTPLNGSITFSSGAPPPGLWTTSGTGVFADPNNTITDYTPSAADLTAGSVTLTLTSSPTAGCLSESDDIIVNFTAAPTADIFAPAEVCANNSIITLNATVTSATGGTWSNVNGVFSGGVNDLLNNDYTPTVPEITGGSVTFILTTTGVGNCNVVQTSHTVTIIDAPIVDAGANQVVCANNANISLNGTVATDASGNGGFGTGQWSTSGTGSFANANDLNTTYTPSPADITAGTVDLTLTSTVNGLCLSESDALTITIVPSPVVDAGPATIDICANNPDVDLIGSITFSSGAPPPGTWTTTGTGTFADATSLVTTYTPSAADIAGGLGTVTHTLTTAPTAGCLSESDNIVVNFTPAPVVNINSVPEVCANNSIVTLNGTVSNATGGIWSNVNGTFSGGATGLVNNDYSPTNPEIAFGSVTFILTSTGQGNCLPVQDSRTVTIIEAPVVDAGTDQTVCANNANIALSGTVTTDPGGNGGPGTGQWSTSGTGSFANTNNLNTTYTPSAADIAAGTVDITLTSTLNGLCLGASDVITLTIVPSPVVDAGPATVDICANNAITSLTGSITFSSGVPPPGLWTTSGSGTFADPTNPITDYTPSAADITAGGVLLTLTSAPTAGCLSESDDVLVSFTPAPIVNINSVPEVCANNSIVTLNGTVANATGAIWSNVNGTFSGGATGLVNNDYSPTNPEIAFGAVTFILTSTGHGNCLPVSDSRTVTIIEAPTVDAGGNQTVCANNANVILNGTITTDPGGSGGSGTGQWSTSGTGSFGNINNLSTTYTPSAADIAAGTVDLTLTSTLNGLCLGASDVITILIIPAPVVDAGPISTDLCANNAVAALNGSINFTSGTPPDGLWTTSGTGVFDDPSDLSANYTPSQADITAGNVILTLTSDVTSGCLSESDATTINYTPAPTANAGADPVLCANNSAISLNGAVTIATGGSWSGGLGSFDPSANDLISTYYPTVGEIANDSVMLVLSTTGNNNCNIVRDTLVAYFTPAPTAEAGSDQTVCANNPAVMLNGAITIATGATWTGGTGTFVPNNTTLAAMYTPAPAEIAAGSVKLYLTTSGNGSCNPVTDSMLITITTSPTADAGPDQTACANNATTSLNGSVLVSSGGQWSGGLGAYTPSDTNLAIQYTPTAAEITAGNVTLTLTTRGNGLCLAESDQVTITFTDAPVVNAGPDQIVSANNPNTSLNGSVVGAPGGTWSSGVGIFNPNKNTLNAVYTPTAGEIADDSVNLVLRSTGGAANCLAVRDTMTIFFSPAPIVEAGPPQTVCANNPDIILNGSVTYATGGQWSGGTGLYSPDDITLNATYTPSAAERTAGFVKLFLTSTGNGLSNPVTDSVLFTITTAPTAIAGPDKVTCSNNPTVSINGSVGIATGGIWTGGTGTYTPSDTNLAIQYTPTPAEIGAGSVTLTLTTTGNGLCLAENDEMTIFFDPSPTANAGPDQTVCANNANASLNGSVTIATGGSWTGGGGFFTPNPNTLNAVYTPTLGEIANDSVNLVLSTNITGNCFVERDTMTLYFSPAPVVDAGTPQTVCGNNPEINLSGSVTVAGGARWTGGTGFYVPNDQALNAVYTPSQAEINAGFVRLYLTSINNLTCNPVVDSVLFTINTAPSANAGPDITACANNPTVSINGLVGIATGGIWYGGAGTYTPSDTNLSIQYSPTPIEIATGSVTLTLTTRGNGLCLAEDDEMTIFFTPAPTADAGPDQIACANNADVNLTGAVTVATGGIWSGGAGTFTPNNQSLTVTYTPTSGDIANDSINLILSTSGNGNCNTVRDTMTVRFTPAPTVDAGPDQSICANNAEAQLAGIVTVSPNARWSGGAGLFIPNVFDLNASYFPSPAEITAGQVTIYLTSINNGLCSQVVDSMVITINPAPTVDAGLDITACSNNPAVNLSGAITVATGAVWQNGTGVFNPGNTFLNTQYIPSAAEVSAGTVTLTLESTGNGNCIPETDQVVINFTPAPTANAGPDQTLCSNNADVTLNGSITVAANGRWSGGAGIYNPGPNNLSIVYSPTASEIANDSVNLILETTGNGNCITERDTMTVFFDPSPVVNAGAPQTVCANNPDINLNGSVTVAGGAQWSGGTGIFFPSNTSLNAVYTPSGAEISAGFVKLYLRSIANGLCKPVVDSVVFTITPAPDVNAGNDKFVCSNNPVVTINSFVSGASGGRWLGGAGTYFPSDTVLGIQYNPTQAEVAAGSLTLTLESTGNGLCNAEIDQVTINFTPSPTADAGPDQIVCANNASVNLNGSVTVATGGNWIGGLGNFTPSSSTLNAVYSPTPGEIANGFAELVLSTTGNGTCLSVQDTMMISFLPAPIVEAGLDQSICSNNPTFSLNGSISNAGGGIWTGGTGVFAPGNMSLNASYTPNAAEIAADTLVLYLTSTGNGLCLAEEDSVTIIFTPSPIVNAGPDITLCANNSLTSLNGSIQFAGGGTWSGGTGLFVPGVNVLNPTYTPTAAEIASGVVTLTLSSTGNGKCLAESDDIQITYSPAPTANAGADQILCGNNADATLAGSVTVATGGTWSGGTGSFNPGPGSLNTIYTPTLLEIANGSLDLILTTTGNGSCIATTDTINLSFSAATTVDAGPDTSVCANNPGIQLSGNVTVATGGIWTGGTGTFLPNNTDLNALYTPSPAEIAAGSARLYLTSTGNGTCLPVVDSVIVTITPSPTVSAGVDQTICANFAQVNLNGIVTVASGGTWTGGLGIFTPSNNHLNAQYFPTPAEIASGSVSLTLTSSGNGQCIQVSDQMNITFTLAPTADAGPDQTLCSNNPDVTLNGSVTIATGGRWIGGLGSFNPNANVLNPVYSPTVGEITNDTLELILLTTGNGNCATVRDTMYVYFTPSPTISAGPDELVCANNADVQLGASFTQSGGMLWTGGTGVFTPNPTDSIAIYTPSAFDKSQGSVTLYATTTNNGNCLAVEDSVKISINPAPVVNAGPDLTVCANNPSVNLSGSVSNAGGGKWIGGTGVFFPNDSSLSAQYTPSAADISSGSMTLKLRTTGNGLCLAEEDSMQIVFTPAPDVNAGPDQIACANNSTITLAGTVNNAGGGQWSGGIGIFNPSSTDLSATYSPTAGEILNGFVNLILTSTGNGNCFPESDTLTIQYTPAPTIDAGPDVTVCETNPNSFMLATVNGATGVQWSGGTGSFIPSPNVLNPTYVASASEIANGSVTLTVSSTGNGTCNSVSDQITINFQSSPIANAGPDQSICANNAVANLGGQFINATGGQWSGGAGLYIPSNLVMNPTYQPSPAEIALGGVSLILNTTGNGVCNSAADTMFISITPAPTVNAGPDQQVCENNAITTLIGQVNGSAGGQWNNVAGSFNPSSNALNTNYTPTAGEIASGSIDVVLTSTGNGNCLAVSDTMNISFAPAPQADAGADIYVCENNPIAQLNGNILNSSTAGGVWTGGSGFFNPNPQTLNAVYTPSSSEIAFGQAVLILVTTNVASCTPDSDEVVINIPPAPTVNAGLDQTLCVTNLNAQLNGSVSGSTNTGQWSTNGTGFFLPNNSALNATYVASSQDSINGQVRLILSSTNNGICNPSSDTMFIYILPAGLSNAGPDQTVCANNSIISLSGSVSGGALSGFWTTSGTGTFDPSDSISNPLYIPSMQDRIMGNLVLTYTAISCNAGSDDMTLTITSAPEVDAGPDQSICDNLPSIQLSGSVSQGASTGSWTSTGTGNFIPNNQDLNASYEPSAADKINGGVLIILTSTFNGTCFAESDTMVLTFSDGIISDAGLDQQVCATASYAQMQGLVSNGSNTGRWTSVGTGTFVPNDTALNAEYHFSAGDVANGSVLLILTSTNNGGCLPARDTMRLSFGPSVFVDAGDDLQLCRNSTNLQLNGFITGGSITGSWSTNGTGIFSPGNQFLKTTYALSAQDLNQNTLEFYLTSTNNGSCLPGFDTMIVSIVDEPNVNTGGPYVGCSYQNEVLLSPTLMNTNSVLWSSSGTGFFLPNDTTPNAEYMPSLADIAAGDVNIELLGLGIANCPNISDFSRIDFISPVTAGFTWDEACQGQSVQFTDTSKVTSGQIDSWFWDFDNGRTSTTQFPFIEFRDAGNFDVKLVVTSSLGCDDSITHAVYIEPAPNARFDVTPLVQKTNLPVNFVDNSERATERIWDFGDDQGSIDPVTQHTYTDTGTYLVMLIVRSDLGCRDTATYNMVIEEDFIYTARVPNAFTPNGDGINDYLIIDGGPFAELELKIYNSWGNLLYESNDVNAAWDGTFKGRVQPNGDYIYTVKGVNVRGERFNRSGSITLMR